MTNALTLVPAFRRQIGVYTQGTTTSDSALAGYIADAVQALLPRWDRGYDIEFISPMTYHITPDLENKDIRPIILMASIIYKMGSVGMISFTDGDFSWNPNKGSDNTIDMDRQELLSYIPKVQLAGATAGQFLGFKSVYNPESYNWLEACAFIWW